MANYTVLPQRLLSLIEGSANGVEKEPKGPPSAAPVEVVQRSVPLTVSPEVAAAGVEQRPEHIDEEALEGTEATPSPSTSHFETMQPVPEHTLKKHAGPLRQLWEYLFTRPKDTNKGELWEIEQEVKRLRLKEYRKKHPEELAA